MFEPLSLVFLFHFPATERMHLLKVILGIGEVVVGIQNVFGQKIWGGGNRRLNRVAFGFKRGCGAFDFKCLSLFWTVWGFQKL